ncbi:hypothetical protein MTR_7g061340 [Medicago truncatula]|uniref:Uncharacterized protein n=1 Tax=Medicago truncatula TaxID=3880 RepID=G7L4J8_MEDTR|nr:hypothetical protein MTR_7g061340 [Medicago truncatula]
MPGLATKKIGAEPGLVPRLAGWWLRPCLMIYTWCGKLWTLAPVGRIYLLVVGISMLTKLQA